MMPGFSDNIQNINDKRKIAGTAAELTRLNVDTIAFTRNRTCLWGFCLKKTVHFLVDGKKHRGDARAQRRVCGKDTTFISDRVLNEEPEIVLLLRLYLDAGPVNIVTRYAPSLTTNPDVKHQF